MKKIIAILLMCLLCGCDIKNNTSLTNPNVVISDMEVSFCDEDIPGNLSINSCVNIRLTVDFAENSEVKRLNGEDIKVIYNKDDVSVNLLDEAGKEFIYTITGKSSKKIEVSFSCDEYIETFNISFYENGISSKLLYVKNNNGTINEPLYISSYSQYKEFVNEYKLPVVGKIITENTLKINVCF